MVFFYFLDTLKGGGVEKVCVDHGRILSSKGHQVYLVPLDGCVGISIPDGCSIVEHYNLKRPAAEEISSILKGYCYPDSELVFVFHMRKSASYFAENISYFGRQEVKSCQFIHADLAYSHGIEHRPPVKSIKLKHVFEFWRIPKILRKPAARLEVLRIIHAHCPLFVVSDLIKNQCAEFGLKKAIVLNNGVDTQWINQMAMKPLCKTPERYFIHVARLSKEKRQGMLLRAYARSKVKLKLVIVGDGPCRSNLERLSQELGIQNKVTFLGFSDNPYPLMKNAEFSVTCSEYEGFGLSIAESISLGVPTLITDRPYGIRSLSDTDNLCYIVEDNLEELANGIKALCQNPIRRETDQLLRQLSLNDIMITFLNKMKISTYSRN
jgi:glycosyltransferase involved in cell wall biosynthesis